MDQSTRGRAGAAAWVIAVLGLLASVPAFADYQASCAGCHAVTASYPGLPSLEVNFLPNLTGSSGSIRAAKNRSYLDSKIAAGMGAGTTAALSAAQRDAIVAEIGASSSVSVPTFTSVAPPGGTFNAAYSHQITTSAKPSLGVGSTAAGAPDPMPGGSTLTTVGGYVVMTGALPPGLSLNGSTGLISGTPTLGGTYTGSIRANNLVGTATQAFSITIGKINQTITFNAQTTTSRTYSPGATFSVSPTATTTSGLAITYTASGACSAPGTTSTTITITGAGTCTITASQAGNANYFAATNKSVTVTITQASQTITFPAQTTTSRVFSAGATFAVSPLATTTSGLPIIYTASGACSAPGTTSTTITITGAGTCTITASQAGDTNYLAALNKTATVTITQATQVISFPAQTTASRPYIQGGTFAVSPVATGGLSGNPILYTTTTPLVCTAAGTSSTTISIVAAGTCTIAANQAGSANFSAASQQTQNVTITAITPPVPTIGTGTAGDASASIGYTLAADTGGSPITSVTAACTAPGPANSPVGGVDGAAPFTAILVTGMTNGATYTCAVRATNIAGNSAFSGTVSVTPSATPVAPTFTSPAVATFTVGSSGTFTMTATGVPLTMTFTLGGSLPTGLSVANGVISGTPALGTVGGYNFVANVSNGTPPSANQAFHIDVVKRNQLLTLTPPADMQFTNAILDVTMTTDSGLTPQLFSSTPDICVEKGTNQLSLVKVGECTIYAEQAGDLNYNPGGDGKYSFLVTPGDQVITFPPQPAAGFSSGGFVALSPPATATSGLPVDYASLTPSVCVTVGAGIAMLSAGTCILEATQSGDVNWNKAAAVQQSIAIGQASQVINWAAAQSPASRTFVLNQTFSVNPLATASSGLTVAYSSGTPVTCSVSGTTVTMLALGTCTVAANQGGDANYTAAPQLSRNITFNVGPPDPPIIGMASPGNTKAIVTFAPPANDGGSAITSYTATCGTQSASGPASPLTVTGLNNNTLYQCTVTATSAGGTSAPSAPASVTPDTSIGQAVFTSVCAQCHVSPQEPLPPRRNAAGVTATVLNYVIANQPTMAASPLMLSVTQEERAEIAAYIKAAAGSIVRHVKPDTPKTVNLSDQYLVGGTAFTSLQVVTQPANGTITGYDGAYTATYTPNPGFAGTDTFTVRGLRTGPTSLQGEPKTVQLIVNAANPVLTIATAGTGTGTVFWPNGASCASLVSPSNLCSDAQAPGAVVTLIAFADGTADFTGWSGGGCTGTGTCTVTMDAAKTVTATFTSNIPQVNLTVTRSGTGTGTVTSSPTRLNCGATCTAAFDQFSTVTLTAAPTAGSLFIGWSGGGCGGTGTCNVTMDVAKSVNAQFDAAPPATFDATVVKAGAGSGTVTSGPAGINCGATCSASFASGATVTLTANAATGSTFAGWSGSGCSGTGTCVLSMSAARAVTATFTLVPTTYSLTVVRAGAGAGTVTSSPGTINCGATCNTTFGANTVVTLTATPATGSSFSGWGGACTGSGACQVTMDAAKSVTATFLLNTGIPRLGNISTRMQVLTGNDVLIGGFIIGGSTPKTVVVRARGPSLIPFGITNALANPTMQLFSGQTVIASSDDFGTAANLAALNASGFAPSDAKESAILTTLTPGAYTAVVSGFGNTTGVGIIEVFEVDHPETPLANISTRGQVLTGGDVMIGGFVIQGDAPQTVIVRARGPSLIPFGITNALADPVLQLFSGQTVIASNDDWQTSPDAANITTRGFAPSDAKESVILITLPPGAYTAIVSGKNGGTGVGIIEVFAQ